MKRFKELFTQNLKHQIGPDILNRCACGSSESLPCVSGISSQLFEKPKEYSKLHLQQGNPAQSTQQHPTNEQLRAESSLAESAYLYSSSNYTHLSNHDFLCACFLCVAAWRPLKRQTGPAPFSAVTPYPKNIKHLRPLFTEAIATQGCLQRAPYSTKTAYHTSGHNGEGNGKKGSSEQQNDDDETEKSDPALQVMTSSTTSSALKTVKVVPGKGPPPEPPLTCCMSGCPNCVWIMYAEELKEYYSDGGIAAKEAIEKIEDPSLKAFIKLELGIK